MEENEILQGITNTLVDTPVEITVDVKPTNWWERKLMQYGLKDKQVTYSLKPLRVGNMYRIAARSVRIPALQDKQNITEALMSSLSEHTDDIIYIVAVGIQNNRHEPTKALMRFIKDEFTMSDIVAVLNKVLIKINIEAFLTTIVLIKGVNALKKASPTDGRE